VVETVEAALCGANAYYWLVQGFGDLERLKDPHFTPIDAPMTNAFSSLAVQGYFCYRIWILNGRSSRLCWAIAVVCIPD